MSLVGAALAAWNLVVFGTHVLAPWRLAEGHDERRRLWALVAPAALVASLLASVAHVARWPDAAAAWGWGLPLGGSPVSALLLVAVAAVLLTDLVIAVGWRRLEPAAWRTAAAIGVLGAAAHALGAELLRAGWGPAPATGAELLALVVLRLPLALAAAELLLGRPRLWTPLAAPALLGIFALWPHVQRAALGPHATTLVAAALLLGIARLAPAGWRRPTGTAGLALALLFLERAAEVSRILGGGERLPDVLLSP